jgi:glutamate synthase domain-containing protein 2
VTYQLRDRIKVIASGKLVTPASVAGALAVGADFVVSARGFMFALGCIQAMQCNKNTCPTGVTTHNTELQRGLDPTSKSYRVANYAQRMHQEVTTLAHSCGVTHPRLLNRSHMMTIDSDGNAQILPTVHSPDIIGSDQ